MFCKFKLKPLLCTLKNKTYERRKGNMVAQ